MKTLGTYLRNLRAKEELSLREVARRASISPAYLCRIEKDQERPPSDSVLYRLSDVFGAEPNVLMHLAGRVPREILGQFREDRSLYDLMDEILLRNLRGEEVLAVLPERGAGTKGKGKTLLEVFAECED